MKIYVKFKDGKRDEFTVDEEQTKLEDLTKCFKKLKDDLLTAALFGVTDKAAELEVKERYNTGVDRILISV